ncbi:MAG: nucleotidyltransferase domain-containing protein [Trueperaceae bacterium]|nr:nucleotidyltransferase domain-containing protein [Trueperaceae bacterium]
MTGEQLERLRDVFARYEEVAGVWLFGSHARGTERARSDVDLAIDPADRTGTGARSRKLDMLTDLVGAGFEDVDLVVLDSVDPVLRFEAIGPNVLVFAAPGYDPAEAFVQALRYYDDTAPLRARIREAYYARLLADDG